MFSHSLTEECYESKRTVPFSRRIATKQKEPSLLERDGFVSSRPVSRVLYRLRGGSNLSRTAVASSLVGAYAPVATNPGERAGSS